MRLSIRKNGKDNNEQIVEFTKGALLSNVLRKEGVFVDMPCSGMGRCGKCRVRFLDGTTAVTDADRRFFSEKKLEDGWRLACRAVLKADAVVEIANSEPGLADSVDETICNEKPRVHQDSKKLVAVDIGTTTIAASLVYSGVTVTCMNHQRTYGADVISRIQAAVSGNADDLKRLVIDDVKGLIKKLLIKAGLPTGTELDEIVIAGNTTMLHLLMGDSCEGLGKAPYKPARLFYPELRYEDVLGNRSSDASVRLLPGISAFVGADIVSGMYALDFGKIPEGKTYILIDLGTNGEMAIADSDRIIVTSTAAGPVFEGGGISCGMPGVEGAIEHVSIGDSLRIETIGNEEPKGICGSGVLELVSELRRCGIIDETGLLMDEYFDEGFTVDEANSIYFKQDDIRAVQLAKAAIRGGIDTLLSEFGCTDSDVGKVFLAGGFSEHITPEDIRYLNILPEEFIDNGVISCIGNASLLGCIKAAMTNSEDDLREIVLKSREVVLASEDAFSEAFLENMNF